MLICIIKPFQMKFYTTLFLSILFLNTSFAQQGAILKKKFHFGQPNDQDSAAGYAQAVLVDNVLYISGTVAAKIDPASVERLYTTIEKTLQHYGAGFQHVVKENLYTTDIEAMKANNHIRKRFYRNDFPAATWVQISRLYMPGYQLEVEVIAHLPKKQ